MSCRAATVEAPPRAPAPHPAPLPGGEREKCGASLRRFVAHRVRSHRQASAAKEGGTTKADAQRGPALSPQRFGRVAQRFAVPPVYPRRLSHNSAHRAFGLIPTRCCGRYQALSLGYFSFTPGILPSALRAGFAVRTRSCACVGQQKKSDSVGGSRSKRPPRRRHAGGEATTGDRRNWIPACAGMTTRQRLPSRRDV